MVHVRGGDPLTVAPQVRAAAMAVDPSLRLVNLRRGNEASDDIRWLMGLWQRIKSCGPASLWYCHWPGSTRSCRLRSPIVVGTAIVFTVASRIKYTEFPGSETDLTLQGMAMIIGYGIVMLGVCMLGCVVPTRRALSIEPMIALRTE